MTVFYRLSDKLYVNITNACPCDCLFCIRQNGEGVGDARSLWLEREPSEDEIKAAFDAANLEQISEIVFCGYGEPMERADTVIELCHYIKSKCSLPLRINTNGLVKLLHPKFEMSRLSAADSVSVSLNADDAAEYARLTRPRFGGASYEAVLDFAREAKKYTKVVFTVVDLMDEKRLENCRTIAKNLGIPLRVRSKE